MYRLATVLASAVLAAAGLALWAQPPADPDEPPVRLEKKGKPPEAADPAQPPAEDKKPDAPPKDDAAKDKPPDKEPPAAEPQESEEEILQRVSKNLQTAEERLANKELGDATVQAQDDVIQDLGKLINKAEQPPPSGGGDGNDDASSSSGASGLSGKASGSSGKASGSSGKGGKAGGKAGMAKGGGDRRTASGRRPQESPATAQGGGNPGGGGQGENGPRDRNADLYKNDVWGHLPETLRAEMNAYANTKGFMPEYETLLNQYYSTIAEQGRRKGD